MGSKFLAHLRRQWMGAFALFLVLTGGVAYASHEVINSSDIVDNQIFSADVRNDTLTGGGLAAADLRSGSVGTAEIGDNQVRSVDVRDEGLSGGGLAASDLRPGSVGSSEVVDNSLTGADINESSLGEVPSARLGGRGGQSSVLTSCNPESTSFTPCAAGTIAIPANTRVLILGQVRAEPDTGNGNGGGSCAVASNLGGFVGASQARVFVNGGQTDVIGISGITDPMGPGVAQLAIECNETADGIRYFDGHVSFVLLSG